MQRVMIVDDEEICGALLESTLEDEFETLMVASGEACLAGVAAFQPDVILLDIEMGGIDGYETCTRLARMVEQGELAERPAVIFISGHDTLEERLRAYESGGDDFVIKPATPAEVISKVRVAVGLVAERKSLRTEKNSIQQMAMGFLTSLGESGTALQYLRGGFACDSYAGLASSTIAALRDYGLVSHVQLRPPNQCLTFIEYPLGHKSGHASPLEESVFEKVRHLDRIFQFRQRLVINYPHVSVLVDNMPIADEERCGRLRDHLAVIAEGCEASVLALMRVEQIEARTRQLQRTALGVRQAITGLRRQYREQQAETRVILLQLTEKFAKELVHMGLTDRQEDQLQTLLSEAINEALQLFQRGLDFDAQLGSLLEDIEAEGTLPAPSASQPLTPG